MIIEQYNYFWHECERQKVDFEKRLRDIQYWIDHKEKTD